jgi:hypothetical protein
LATITLAYGAETPLVLEPPEGSLVRECHGPTGATEAAAGALVAAAIGTPAHGPPLAAHVVPGDRVAVAVAGDVPQADSVVAAVVAGLAGAGVAADSIHVLHAAAGGAASGPPGSTEFDATVDAATSYLAADETGEPLYLARQLVDADVVVAVGAWGWNAAIGGRSLAGELDLARRGRLALADWKARMHDITWQLGVCASLRIVAGSGGSLHAAAFGLPDEASRLARSAARAWCPAVDEPVELTVVSLSDPRSFPALTAAVAAAARVTEPGGTICVASRLDAEFGPIFCRWRDGAPLDGLVREALASGDEQLIVEAFQTRFFARALGERHLVLLSDIDGDKVEELEFGHAADPAVVARLARRAPSVTVLHEADRMRPRRA